jgi:RNA ligase
MDGFPVYEDDGTSLFPVNITLAEARAAVAGRIDFRETSEHDYVSFIYFLGMAPDLFPDPNTAPDAATKRMWQIRRECRGIIFHKDGFILSRRFQKFFNIGELPETQPDLITIHPPFVLLEKLDGSMIAPFLVEGTLRYCTKSGYTDSSKIVETFVNKHAQDIPYTPFCTEAIQFGFTPIFEWCSPTGRIVLEYKEETLHLLALRHMVTGRYVPFDTVSALAKSRGIPMVQKWPLNSLGITENEANVELSGQNLLAVNAKIQAQVGVEGFVLQQADGVMYKIKTAWYFQLHRSTQFLKYYGEKHIWEAILKGTVDDVKAWLPVPVRDAINAFATEMTTRAEVCAKKLTKLAKDGFAIHSTRAAFNANIVAVEVEPSTKVVLWKAFAELTDGKQLEETKVFEWILETMLVNCSSPKTLKKNVAFVGDLTYETYRPKNETPHIFTEDS